MTDKSNSIFNLQVDEQGSYYLKETAKWAKFLGVIGLVFTTLFTLGILGFVIFAFQSDSAVFNSVNVAPFIGYLVIILIYVYPIYSIFAFGKKIKNAIASQDQLTLNNGLKHLKNAFLFMGIITLVILFFYLIFFVIFAIKGASNIITG